MKTSPIDAALCSIADHPLRDIIGVDVKQHIDAAWDLFERTKLRQAGPVCFRLRRLDGGEVWTDIQAAPRQFGLGRTWPARKWQSLQIAGPIANDISGLQSAWQGSSLRLSPHREHTPHKVRRRLNDLKRNLWYRNLSMNGRSHCRKPSWTVADFYRSRSSYAKNCVQGESPQERIALVDALETISVLQRA